MQRNIIVKQQKYAEKIMVDYPKPSNIVVAGLGGSAIGGDLLKDWAKNQLTVPIEVSREYQLPAYARQENTCFHHKLLRRHRRDIEQLFLMHSNANA